MPPKKSKAAPVFTASDHADTEGQGLDKFALPRSTVTRIAKQAVPDSAKFEKDIPLALVGGSTIFINYLTSLAHDIAQEKGQKTITATHVLEAVKQLGWDDEKEVVKALKGELKAHRKLAEAKKNGTAPPPKPRAPGARPFGRPPKTATTPAASTSTSTSPAAEKGTLTAEPQPEQQEEDSSMTILRDDGPGSGEREGAEGEEGEGEGEDDEEAYGTNEEDEAEEEGIDEMEEPEEEEREDRVGDGLEDEVTAAVGGEDD
ncbi:histone-fold-containing protein [Leucosporidium creatinivorum]|uniref:DNA polymerase epsilon subunit D n=1 Tax=Leucosporidium creatinivorum TaxID=106004 RepID=A0A1Y2G4V3_9BASI|nr:histone-fold-containing protein [Leucosporidium creatinivorum]